MRRAAACVAVAAALAAGCAKQDRDDVLARAARTTTTAPATTTTAGDQRTAAGRRADLAAAKRMALAQGDLPPGWTAEPPDPEDEADAGSAGGSGSGAEDDTITSSLASCLHVAPDAVASDDPEFDSPTFTNTDGDAVETAVSVAASVAANARQLAVFKAPNAPACFAQAFKAGAESGAPPGATVGNPTAVAVPIERVGDDAIEFRITLPLSAEGRSLTVTADVVLVTAGRAAILASFSTYRDQPFDAALARQLIQKVVDRAPPA